MSDIIPGSSEKCMKCGAEYAIGDWYLCPHGRGTMEAIEDSIPGGFVQENFGDKPEVFYSKKAMLARADELGLRQKDQWAGPGDRYLSNWAAVSEKTLRDAKALLERVGTAPPTRARCETAQFTIGPWRES